MRAGAKSAFFTGGAAVPAPCLHIVGTQEIVPGQLNARSGLGDQGMGAGGEGVPRRGKGVSTGPEEAAGALEPEEVQRGRSKGPAEGRWAQRAALQWAGLSHPREGVFQPRG